ncbi:hypothetical protein NFHSH190041_20250 [Shewanella sp. NFH-SH190041]|nr:hypothetical protein NFHSH190041_20250 [Shewanella sp. NFH-SH190041]
MIHSLLNLFRQPICQRARLAVAENPDRNNRQLREFRRRLAVYESAQERGGSVVFPLPIFKA